MNTRIMNAFLAITLPLILISTAWGAIDTMALLERMVNVKQSILEQYQVEPENHAVVLSVNASGQPQVDHRAVPIAFLEGVLKAMQERDPDINIQLQVNRSTEFASVAEVIASAQHAGLSKLSFVPLDEQ